MSSRLQRLSLAYLIPLLTALLGLAVQVLDPPAVSALRLAVFDQFQRWHPRAYTPVPVRIVDIDEASLSRLGQWPWPRTLVAELTQRIRGAGAKAIGFDFIFAEPDRSTPRQAAAAWSLPPGLGERLFALPDHDELFAAQIRAGGVVLGAGLDRAAGSAGSAGVPPTAGRFVTLGTVSMKGVHGYQMSSRPLADLESAAAGVGALNFVPDADGVVRRVPMLLSLNAVAMPSLDAEMLRVSQGAANYLLRSAGEAGEVASVRVGELEVPVNAHGEFWVHFSPPVAERRISAWRVLRGDVPRELLDGNLVLIGASAQGLLDLRFSPLGGVLPGIDVHAQALEQVLSGHWLERPWWALPLEALALVACMLAAGVVARVGSATVSAIVVAVLLTALALGSWLAFRHQGLLLDASMPGIAALLAFVLASVAHHRDSERRQRWVREAFSHYVSPNLVEHLVEHPDKLQLGGERRECSFVFTDLADFTRLMESLDPARAVSLLNSYLDGMIAIAFRHEGTLDRVVGDAIAIMFSAPVVQPDHRQRALDCALAMQAHANAHRAQLAAEGVTFGITRIGVHAGEVIVGNLGGTAIFDYRALGDPVNTTARLETANKQLGTQVCVSAAIVDACAEPQVRPIGQLLLKGKREPVMAYEPLGNQWAQPPRDPEFDADYQIAYQRLAHNTNSALALFESLAARHPDDALVAFHLARLHRGEGGQVIVLNEK